VFTGIIEGLGELQAITPAARSYSLTIELGPLAAELAIGDSVAVNGTCLTATRRQRSRVSFDVIAETVARTNLATLKVGARVNIERSMLAGGRFHGHFVTGHVDGTGRLQRIRRLPEQTVMSFDVNPKLTRQMITKGSIAIDGISLTLSEVTERSFSVCLIPHTLKVTTLGSLSEGALVNVETDQLGKWVRRLLAAHVPGMAAPEGSDEGLQGIEEIGPVLRLEDLHRFGL